MKKLIAILMTIILVPAFTVQSYAYNAETLVTATFTATSTATYSATPTETPSDTPTPSATPTYTPTTLPTPTPTPIVPDISVGIDVSEHNGNINWSDVKEFGIDYTIIRLGYRGWGTGKLVLDSYYARNIQGAINAGIQVGVYFFSEAITEKEAIEEANMALKHVKNYNITCPIVFDTEMISNSPARANNLTAKVRTNIVIAFCETIKKAGYIPMVYSNAYFLKNNLQMSRLGNYDIWVAQFGLPISVPSNDYVMWQFTDTGYVNGVEGHVDIDFRKNNPSVDLCKYLRLSSAPKAVSSGYDRIKIRWGRAPGADEYGIYRATTIGGTYYKIGTTTSTSFENIKLAHGKTYYYKIRVFKTIHGNSKIFISDTNVTGAKSELLSPVNLRAKRLKSTAIIVTWQGTRGASGYQLFSKISSTDRYKLLRTTKYGNYTNTKLTKGKTYYYKVRAFEAIGKTKIYSNYSKAVGLRL
jgi:GH25 family lysozyme M1 (1,4-beta-N-acetylmuramidase)